MKALYANCPYTTFILMTPSSGSCCEASKSLPRYPGGAQIVAPAMPDTGNPQRGMSPRIFMLPASWFATVHAGRCPAKACSRLLVASSAMA